jgi:2-oxoisovalerate dehydrogenase E1 component
MLISREFDRRAAILHRQGKAWFHISSAGHEGLATVATVLNSSDFIFPHYRDRAMLLQRGMSVTDMAHDLLGTASSHSGGRNMSSHFSNAQNNIFSIASPVGIHCLPAVGVAWSETLRSSNNVVVCSIGDASVRQGEFFEALTFAIDKTLPVLFLISDNGYGISTPTSDTAPLHP